MIPGRKIFTVIFLFAALACGFLCRAGFQLPQSPQNYINDYAGVLTAGQESELNSYLSAYQGRTTNQIVVAVFSSLEGESLEDVSIQLAERWKPGQKGKDNGAVLLVFLREKKVRIEVGYGLEASLTDAIAKTIISREITPQFRKGDYYSGIKSGLSQMTMVISGGVSPQNSDRYARYSRTKNKNPIVSLLMFIFFIFIFIRHPFLALFLFSGGFSSGGRYSGGGFGGFSGGGGSFGGGGASGGW